MQLSDWQATEYWSCKLQEYYMLKIQDVIGL